MHLFLELLNKASDAVRAKLEAVHPRAKDEVRRAVTDVADRIRDDALGRDRGAALVLAQGLWKAGRLDDAWLRKSAQAGLFTEVVAALAVMSGLSQSFVEQALVQERSDMTVVIAKALALSWPTVKSLLLLQTDRPVSNRAIEQALASFERLNTIAAREIVRFYSLRDQPPPRLTN